MCSFAENPFMKYGLGPLCQIRRKIVDIIFWFLAIAFGGYKFLLLQISQLSAGPWKMLSET